MVIFGGLELVAAGYIVHKHSKNKKEKQRLEEEAAATHYQHQQQRTSPHRRKHSGDRKHSHDNKHTYDGRRPSRESRPQQGPQYLYTDTSQPPRASSAPPAGYPPTGWPAHWHAPPQQQQNVYPPNAYPPNYAAPPTYSQQNQYPQPPPLGATRDLDQKTPSQPQDIPRRGRREAQASASAAELSASGPRMYNTHLSPTPHVRFAVPNDGPQPGDGLDPPPEYRI